VIYRLYFVSSAANETETQIKHTEHTVQLHTQ